MLNALLIFISFILNITLSQNSHGCNSGSCSLTSDNTYISSQIYCTENVNHCSVHCTTDFNNGCRSSSIWLSATMNTLTCDQTQTCEDVTVYCGYPYNSVTPTGLSLADFDDNTVSECHVTCSNYFACNGLKLYCNGNISLCTITAYNSNSFRNGLIECNNNDHQQNQCHLDCASANDMDCSGTTMNCNDMQYCSCTGAGCPHVQINSMQPTISPMDIPTAPPTTVSPSRHPSTSPTTAAPTTAAPTTANPSDAPTKNPSAVPAQPTPEPTTEPTTEPTMIPIISTLTPSVSDMATAIFSSLTSASTINAESAEIKESSSTTDMEVASDESDAVNVNMSVIIVVCAIFIIVIIAIAVFIWCKNSKYQQSKTMANTNMINIAMSTVDPVTKDVDVISVAEHSPDGINALDGTIAVIEAQRNSDDEDVLYKNGDTQTQDMNTQKDSDSDDEMYEKGDKTDDGMYQTNQ